VGYLGGDIELIDKVNLIFDSNTFFGPKEPLQKLKNGV
jgi:hypothetical protein